MSSTALFIRSSGRLGLWAIALGAAANVYYHQSFTTIVVSQVVNNPTPPKLYEKTERYTVEDGCLAGAAVGFVAFLPTLFMRKPSVPWWTRMMGMANIGACTGVLASHAYFQYTGERQKGLEELERQRRRRMLEFHHIFWDKMLMQQFDPLMQGYIRHNGVFRAYNLPSEVYDAPEKFGILSAPAPASDTNATGAQATSVAYYAAAPDWAEHLKSLNADYIRAEVEENLRKKEALLKEAEYMAYFVSQKQYAYAHSPPSDEEDKQTCIRELQLLSLTYNRLRVNADDMDRRVFAGRHWLRQIAAAKAKSPREAWLTEHPSIADTETHDPSLSIAELKKLEDQFRYDASVFESRVRSQAQEDVEKRGRWRQDLEDARTLLRAVERLSWELEKKVPKEEAVVVVEKKNEGEEEIKAVKVVEEVAKEEDAAKAKAEDSPGAKKPKKVKAPPERLSPDKS